jgi:hypothetical protein
MPVLAILGGSRRVSRRFSPSMGAGAVRPGLGLPIALSATYRSATSPNAGTENKVLAALNDANYTVLDTPVNDFEGATGRTYDLLLTGVVWLQDIKYLKIFKGGSDGVCISQLTLLVNERPIFTRTLAASQQWLDSEYYGYDSRTLMQRVRRRPGPGLGPGGAHHRARRAAHREGRGHAGRPCAGGDRQPDRHPYLRAPGGAGDARHRGSSEVEIETALARPLAGWRS